MRLDVSPIIHTPGGRLPFSFQMDLSDLEFYGARPIDQTLNVLGEVRNMAGALTLSAVMDTELDLTCDRCTASFRREKTVTLETLVADHVEDEESMAEIVLLDGFMLDLDQVATTAFVLDMDTKNLCSEDCQGLCSKCGANLNDGACDCKGEIDPRLAALTQLLDQENS